jgi:hypothetical protein
MRAAQGTGVKVIKRKVFLDDTQNEADIRYQFNRALSLWRAQRFRHCYRPSAPDDGARAAADGV